MLMDINCCFKVATLIIGYLNIFTILIGSTIILPMILRPSSRPCLCVSETKNFEMCNPENHELEQLVPAVIFSVFCVLCAGLHILLLIGAYKEYAEFILPWLIVLGICLFLNILRNVLFLFGVDQAIRMNPLLENIFLILFIFAYFCVLSFYKSLGSISGHIDNQYYSALETQDDVL